MMNGFLTLRKILEDLKNKIDEDYADRIEKTSNPKLWDSYESKSVEASETIDKVIRWAESRLPELIDAELIREIVLSAQRVDEISEADAMFTAHQQMKEAHRRIYGE